MFQLSSQECPSFFGSALGSTEEINDQTYIPKLPSELPPEHSSSHSWLSEDTFKDGETPVSVCPAINTGEASLHAELETNVSPYDNKISSSSSSFSEGEPEPTDVERQKKLIWIDQSHDLSSYSGLGTRSNGPSSTLEDVDGVRMRLEKRKRRISTKNLLSEDLCETKRVRNTIAARRYRQRRQKEVEILDKKVKELEHELSTTKMETKWWQMEAQRWQKLAEKREEK